MEENAGMKEKLLMLLAVGQSRLLAVFFTAVILTACKTGSRDLLVAERFRALDRILRQQNFRYDSMRICLREIEKDFIHTETKHTGFEARTSTVRYLWNADSTITMIRSRKTFPVGFNREVIIHAGDSILFIHRFSTEPLGMANKSTYTLLESVYYLNEVRTIRHLDRIDYNVRDLNDTIEFRKKPFANLADDISHYYSMELNYSKNILGLN